jgi:hypothetical protein
MKIPIVPIVAVQIMISCSPSVTGDADASPVEGTYVMHSKGDFSIAEDTLAILPIQNQKDIYTIERRVGYQRITETGIQPKEIRQEKATAIWYAISNQLKEQKKGRVYSLSTDGKQLLIGSTAYTRILDR